MALSVLYADDRRYPGPIAHPAPPTVTGLPTQAELDAHPRLFTWGELKGIICSGDLEQLMRNKALQARYDAWMAGMKKQFGSTEKYLTQARLPWATAPPAEPTYDQRTAMDHPEVDLTPSTNPAPGPGGGRSTSTNTAAASARATAAGTPARAASVPGSRASTPASAGFVSLSAIKLGKALGVSKRRTTIATTTSEDGEDGEDGEGEGEGESEAAPVVHLKYDAEAGFERDKYAVLPNDWPYCIPYGVRHFCVWSRIPIVHPALVGYDHDAWAKIEAEGLGGFTGVTPINRSGPSSPASAWASRPPTGPSSPSPASPTRPGPSLANGLASGLASSASTDSLAFAGRGKSIRVKSKAEWYAVDVAHAGGEMRRWAGIEYECAGGHEVGRMVRALWDERGWECLWFVNPPRLQSIPGFSHFHVFARRKTPDEIDAAEAAAVNGPASPIVAVGEGPPLPAERVDCTGLLLSLGLIDIQTNDAFGIDLSEPAPRDAYVQRVGRMIRGLAKIDLTSFVPTIITPKVSHRILPIIADLARAPPSGDCATPLGWHAEGPFLCPNRAGCRPPANLAPAGTMDDIEQVGAARVTYDRAVLDGGPDVVRLITLALDVPSVPDAVPALAARPCDATHAQAAEADCRGARLLTHLYNAKPPLSGVALGLAAPPNTAPPTPRAAAEATVGLDAAGNPPRPYFGIIADGVHVHPLAVGHAYLAHPAGILPLLEAIANLFCFAGIALRGAIVCTTYNLAPCLGPAVERRKATLKPGADADFCLWAPDGQVVGVWKAARRV
ncbi:hypothetical protein Q5752_004581 [Cryptotrichosporon argae]